MVLVMKSMHLINLHFWTYLSQRVNCVWILFQISETEEESSLVFFEPESPFFLLTLQVGGATLGVFIVCGIVFEAYQRKGRKMVQTGKFIVSHGLGDQTIFLTASILVTQVISSVTLTT